MTAGCVLICGAPPHGSTRFGFRSTDLARMRDGPTPSSRRPMRRTDSRSAWYEEAFPMKTCARSDPSSRVRSSAAANPVVAAPLIAVKNVRRFMIDPRPRRYLTPGFGSLNHAGRVVVPGEAVAFPAHQPQVTGGRGPG